LDGFDRTTQHLIYEYVDYCWGQGRRLGTPTRGLSWAIVEFVLDLGEAFGGVDAGSFVGKMSRNNPLEFSLVSRRDGERG
jgi:hypothetical protein